MASHRNMHSQSNLVRLQQSVGDRTSSYTQIFHKNSPTWLSNRLENNFFTSIGLYLIFLSLAFITSTLSRFKIITIGSHEIQNGIKMTRNGINNTINSGEQFIHDVQAKVEAEKKHLESELRRAQEISADRLTQITQFGKEVLSRANLETQIFEMKEQISTLKTELEETGHAAEEEKKELLAQLDAAKSQLEETSHAAEEEKKELLAQLDAAKSKTEVIVKEKVEEMSSKVDQRKNELEAKIEKERKQILQSAKQEVVTVKAELESIKKEHLSSKDHSKTLQKEVKTLKSELNDSKEKLKLSQDAKQTNETLTLQLADAHLESASHQKELNALNSYKRHLEDDLIKEKEMHEASRDALHDAVSKLVEEKKKRRVPVLDGVGEAEVFEDAQS